MVTALFTRGVFFRARSPHAPGLRFPCTLATSGFTAGGDCGGNVSRLGVYTP